ncbi:hypothetical protein KQX54_011106 [Cotesia glomerata]|uniref:Uncharacterized protein n=1 Tax=Cotesia glomerata TaxID=32391 RepID=A0AAV7IKH9_COTGL|nr:hypothetical protein KQX54_011106 [Cotesia glomerata]
MYCTCKINLNADASSRNPVEPVNVTTRAQKAREELEEELPPLRNHYKKPAVVISKTSLQEKEPTVGTPKTPLQGTVGAPAKKRGRPPKHREKPDGKRIDPNKVMPSLDPDVNVESDSTSDDKYSSCESDSSIEIANELKKKQDTGQVYWTKKGNTYYFVLVIRGTSGELIIRVRSNIAKCLVKLKGILKDKGITNFLIAFSEFIENIPWKEVLCSIRRTQSNIL